MVERMRDQLRTELVRLELREEEVRDLRDRNAHLELELKRQGRQLTNALKDNVELKKKLHVLQVGPRPNGKLTRN